jgi:predicted RND superfamily exporter protein
MSGIRDRIEAGFEAFGAAICRRARLVIAVLALAVGGLAAQGSRVVMDTSPEGMLHETDPARLAYDALGREFQGDSPIVVGVRAPATFDDAFLARLGALRGDLERDVPHLENPPNAASAVANRSRLDACEPCV